MIAFYGIILVILAYVCYAVCDGLLRENKKLRKELDALYKEVWKYDNDYVYWEDK